jgi:hypothetical protein
MDVTEHQHHDATAHSPHSENSMEGSLEKEAGAPADATKATHLETIRTVSRVPGNPNYYEKNGLRTYGDDEDRESNGFSRYGILASNASF